MTLGRIFVAILALLLILKAVELVGLAMGWGLECWLSGFCR